MMFQFLIGIINLSFPVSIYPGSPVSIPHRYYKSLIDLDCGHLIEEVSIPHRYYKSLKAAKTYRGTKKVSIPHRYYKSGLKVIEEVPEKCFNSS